jgi:excisionase family DNA binding protein
MSSGARIDFIHHVVSQSTIMKDALLDTEEAAEYMRVPAGTLRQWRYLGRGPAYVHVGRAVRYREGDLDAWLEANTTRPAVS